MRDTIAETLPGVLHLLGEASEQLFDLANALSDLHCDSVADAGLIGAPTPGWVANLYDLSSAVTKLAARVESWDPTDR